MDDGQGGAGRAGPRPLRVECAVSPLDLRINTRYFGSQAIPQSVRDAVLTVVGATKDAIEDQGWTPFPGPASVRLTFRFPEHRGDIDGPVKRVLDAVQDGIKQTFGPRSFDDGRIKRLEIDKINVKDEGGATGIVVEVEKWSRWSAPSSRSGSSSGSGSTSVASSGKAA